MNDESGKIWKEETVVWNNHNILPVGLRKTTKDIDYEGSTENRTRNLKSMNHYTTTFGAFQEERVQQTISFVS
jgi:hypothetical protein